MKTEFSSEDVGLKFTGIRCRFILITWGHTGSWLIFVPRLCLASFQRYFLLLQKRSALSRVALACQRLHTHTHTRSSSLPPSSP